MTIEFHCPHCDKLLRTADEKAGAKAKCPGCKHPVTVPVPARAEAAADEFDFGGLDSSYDDYGGPAAEDDYGAPGLPPMVGGTKECPMCGGTVKTAAVKCRHCGEDLGGARTAGGRHVGNHAGFWLRFAAWFIDYIVVNAVSFVVGAVIGFIAGVAMAAGGGAGDDTMAFIQIVAGLIGFVLSWLYYAIMESSTSQATLGKMALGLVVTDMDGRRIGFGKASGRFFGKILSGMICAVGYIMAGFTEKKQALHDMMAGTLVVRK